MPFADGFARAKAAFVSEDSISFGRLFINPGKIVCVGLNYRAHAEETGEALPKVPILFNKYSTAMNHHGGTIRVQNLPRKGCIFVLELPTD